MTPRIMAGWIALALLLSWCVGMFGRGYWTPDEPREADIAWRMSWQSEKSVPVLAGEAFCEKPPLTYWLAALPIRFLGDEAWSARLPNLLYALLTALGVGLLCARSAGRFAGVAGAAVISTFLLSYQVAIWLATDAPLLATVSVALLGAYIGFYAKTSAERLRGYCLMHIALGLGFLSKSAAAWMVPALAIITLSLWERRWRELLRWELYAGLPVQAAMILGWVWFVYHGDEGPEHLKVFFWNNLVGRFAAVDAPPELQYASAHRNSPGKYLIELPVYLFPWTLLVIAAARRAWVQRRSAPDDYRSVRFAIAASLPALAVLSLAATARNIYFAPALPGAALLLAWWAREVLRGDDVWDLSAMRGTALLLGLSIAVLAAALIIAGNGADSPLPQAVYATASLIGFIGAAYLVGRAWAAARGRPMHALWALLLAYCVLLIGPASQLYRRADSWQNLAKIGGAVQLETAGKPLVLLAPDETTRAMIDMYARSSAARLDGPVNAAWIARVRSVTEQAPQSFFLTQLPSQAPQLPWRRKPTTSPAPAWLDAANLQWIESYALPNGRRYALLVSARNQTAIQ